MEKAAACEKVISAFCTANMYLPSTYSNGEQINVLLAALFLNEGHFLPIDEPTNHLDADARKKVCAYLKKRKDLFWCRMIVNF